MFVRTTKKKHKGKIYEHAKIVESIREGKRTIQKVVKNLGPINSEEDRKRIEKIDEFLKSKKKVFALEELHKKKDLEYGIPYVTQELWKRFNLDQIMHDCAKNRKVEFNFEMISSLLVANRLSEPSSELSVLEWIKEDAYVKDKDEIQLQHLYKALDILIENKEKIETSLFPVLVEKLKLDTRFAFYDLTSSYFEGKGNGNLVLFGYNRDKKKSKKQIVISLLLIDGIPVFHEVFSGNTVDKATLKKTIDKIKNQFGLKNIVVVADRGLFTDENIEWLEDDKENMFIMATKRRRHKEMENLMTEETGSWKEFIKEKQTQNEKKEKYRCLYKIVKEEGDKKYILCLNEERANEDRKRLEQSIEGMKIKLDKTKQGLKKRKKSEKKLWKSVANILGKRAKFFDIKFKENDFDYSLNEKVRDYENKICGRFLLVSKNKLPTELIIEKYKELAEIEQGFREIKSILKVRPDFHKKDERIKAHVFVVMLSFLLLRIMERYLKDLHARMDKILREMKRIRVSMIDIGNEQIEIMSDLNKEQKEILKKMSMAEPMC